MGEITDRNWLIAFQLHLAAAATNELTPEQMAQRIHEALEIAEAPKYATEKSRFGFGLRGATADDIAEIRRHLTPFENSIVEIETQ